jgi:tetratricopeptide (TPR) repeat protein
MRRLLLLLVLGATVMLTLRPSPAHAQMEKFVQAVRELAEAAGQPEPSRANGIRTAADRMGTALVAWDRQLNALEDAAAREISAAPAPRAYRLHVELGVAYRARGRLADALREFDAAVAIQPSASDVQVLRALTLEAAGRSEEAGKAFRTAWSLDPRNPVKAYYVAQRPEAGREAARDSARAVLTETYGRLGVDAARPAAAPFAILGAIPDNLSPAPVVADGPAFDGFAMLSAGKYGEAVAALKRGDRATSEQTRDSPVTHLARGQRDEAENRVADARREYQAALAGTLLGRSVLLVGIARLAQVEGDLAGAIDAFAQAVRLHPNDPNIRKEFAGAYAAEGRADDAFGELMAALLINGRDAQAHAAIGQLDLDAGRDAQAVAAFNRALELMPDRYEIRYALATAHTRVGNTAEAARQLEIFERFRREALERRRRDIASDVEQQEALRPAVPDRVGR